jgi:predicted phage terminase large subunit-like protein
MKFKTTKQQKKALKKLVSNYFKNKKGEPYELTDSQCNILGGVLKKGIKYLWITAPTRYGKTEVLAIGVIILAVFYNLKVPIVGGSREKARKIMEYILQHLSDHPELHKGLINIKGFEDIDKFKVRVSKDVLRWVTGGWIYITSIDSRQLSKEGESVVGEGGDVIILEEAGLIKHKEQFSKIVRMTEGEWGKLIMSGNCIEKSVFEEAYNSNIYVKIKIGLKEALREKRYTPLELYNKKKQTTGKDWKRYYRVEFPKAEEFAYFKPRKYEVLPNIIDYYGAVDLALGESKKGSLTGISVIGKDEQGQFYEIETIGEILKPEETIRRIFNLPYKFTRFGVEAVQFQKYFLHQIERESKQKGKYIPFEGIQQSKKKEERIESLEPVTNTGQILFSGRGPIWDHMMDYPDCPLDVLDSMEMVARISGLTGEQFIGFIT